MVLKSCGQDDFKFCRCNPRSGFRSTPWYLHLVVKMSSNLADLPLDLLEDAPSQHWHLVVKMISNLADLPPWYWHLTVKMSSNMADLPLDLLEDAPSQHWNLVVKMISNLEDLPLDLLEDAPSQHWNLVVKMISNLEDQPLGLLTEQSLPVLTSHGQGEFKFGRSIPRSADRSTPHYWHLVVKMISNLADLSLDLLAELHP